MADTQPFKVLPAYASINAVRDICEPWIELWGGDEWGESMRDLHGAAHTSYGLSDEDCATVAEILIRNVIALKEEWIEGEDYDMWGYGYDDESGPAALAETRKKSSEARDYWLKGGNLGDFSRTIQDAKETIEQMPAWLFEDVDRPRLEV